MKVDKAMGKGTKEKSAKGKKINHIDGDTSRSLEEIAKVHYDGSGDAHKHRTPVKAAPFNFSPAKK